MRAEARSNEKLIFLRKYFDVRLKVIIDRVVVATQCCDTGPRTSVSQLAAVPLLQQADRQAMINFEKDNAGGG